MFKLKTVKVNGKTEVEFNGKYTLTQLDDSFKDICIALINEKRNIDNYVNRYNGYLEIQVNTQTRNFSEDEKALVEMKILPMNTVLIASNGYCFEDILLILDIIQKQIIKEHNPNFTYNVNFVSLYVGEKNLL